MLLHCAADVGEIVGDHAEPDPALHSVLALVAATVEAVSPLHQADTTLASGTPFLTVAEPALLLFASALSALGRAVGNAHTLDTLGFRRGFILAGIEGSVGGDEVACGSVA